MTVGNSRKKCPLINSETPPFFSLVDYRNNYFTSDDPNKIIEFYNGFENRDQLIQWMRERPKGIANIHEFEGDKDIIVVIPTADFDGKYARECRDNIFKGLHIIFVESGEVPDPYFNYAHNCNVGISKAMKYNPKWIILSNDDISLEIFGDQLISQLATHQDDCILFPHRKFNKDYVFEGQIFRARLLSKIGYILYSFKRSPHLAFYLLRIILGDKSPSIIYATMQHGILFKLLRIFGDQVTSSFRNFADFVIVGRGIIEYFNFNELFINGLEDVELAHRLFRLNVKEDYIQIKEHSDGGGTFGSHNAAVRFSREYANYIVLESALDMVKKRI